jgi:hypothetical protein
MNHQLHRHRLTKASDLSYPPHGGYRDSNFRPTFTLPGIWPLNLDKDITGTQAWRSGLKSPAARWTLITASVAILLAVTAAVILTGNNPMETASVDSEPTAGEDTATVTIRSLNPLYRPGEAVSAEGTISNAARGEKVNIEIEDPEGDLWASSEVEATNSGGDSANFSTLLPPVQPSDPPGIYILRVEYGDAQGNSSFLISTTTNLTAEIQSLEIQNTNEEQPVKKRAGDIILVAASVANLKDISRELTFVVEMRDDEGEVAESGFVSTSLPGGGEKTLTVGWPTAEKGTFTIYAYVQEDIQSRSIVSNIAAIDLLIE